MSLQKKSSWVFQALLLSIGCNICLMGGILFLSLREGNARALIPYAPSLCSINKELSQSTLKNFQKLSFSELVERLLDTSFCERSVKVQEVALHVLTKDFMIDVERALGFRAPRSKRGGNLLTQEEYQRLALFLKREKYPFKFLQCLHIFKKNPGDHQLSQWLLNSPQVLCVKELGAYCKAPLTEVTLLKLLMEGNGEPIQILSEERKGGEECSKELWHRFLVRSVRAGSKTAAYLIVVSEINPEETVDVETQLMMIRLMDERTPEATLFLQRLLEKPCLTEALREEALGRYAAFTQQDHSHRGAMDRT